MRLILSAPRKGRPHSRMTSDDARRVLGLPPMEIESCYITEPILRATLYFLASGAGSFVNAGAWIVILSSLQFDRKVKNLRSNGSDMGTSLADSLYDTIRHPFASRISRFPH